MVAYTPSCSNRRYFSREISINPALYRIVAAVSLENLLVAAQLRARTET